MAEIKIDLTPLLRPALIQGLADVIPSNLIEGVVIALLRRDPTTRCILAEELGEQALKEKAADDAAQAELDRTEFLSDPPEEKSWDQIMLEVLNRMADTPGGRGEVG